MKMLLSNQEFENTWQFYNDYLLESHGVILNFKERSDQLNMLDQISHNNPETAIEILEIMIARGETTIFMPNANEFS